MARKPDDVVLNIRTEVEEAKELARLQSQVERFGESSESISVEVDELVDSINSIAEAQEIATSIADATEEFNKQSDALEKAKNEYRLANEAMINFSDSMSDIEKREASAALKSQEREVNKLTTAYERSEKRMVEANQRYDQASGYVKTLAKDTDLLEDALQQATEKQANLNKELEGLKDLSFARKDLGVKDWQKEIDQLESSYKTLESSGKLTTEELKVAHRNLTKEVDQYRKKLDGTENALAKMKSGLPTFIAMAGAFTKLTKDAIDFESAMADVAKVLGSSDEETKELSKNLLDLSKTIPLTADELAKIAESGAQIGLAADELMGYTEQIAKMSVAFGISTEKSGQAVASLMNIFQIGIEGVNELSDAINYLSNNGAADAESIIDVLTRIGGAASNFGLAKEEIAALSSSFLALGMSPEIASTSIRNFLTDLATAESKGADFQNALKKMGLSSVELAQQIKDNPQKAITGFLETVNQFNEEGGNVTNVLTDLFGKANQANIATMASNSNELAKAMGMVGDQSKYAGSVQEEFEKRMETAGAQIDLMKNNLNALSITLGNNLLPAITMILKATTGLIGGFADLATEYPTLTKIMMGMTALGASTKLAAGAFDYLAIKGKQSLFDIDKGLGDVTKGARAARVATVALSTAFAGLTAASAGYSLGKELRKDYEWIEKTQNYFAHAISSIGTTLKADWEMVSSGIKGDWEGVVDALNRGNETLERGSQVLKEMNEDLGKQREHEENAIKNAKDRQEALEREVVLEGQLSRIKQDGIAAAQRASEATQEEIDSLERLVSLLNQQGLSYTAIEQGISTAGNEAINIFNAISSESTATAKIINESFVASLSEIETPQDLKNLLEVLQEIKEAGKIDGDEWELLEESVINLSDALEAGVKAGAEFDEVMKREIETLKKKKEGIYTVTKAQEELRDELERSIEMSKEQTEAEIRALEAKKRLAEAEKDTHRAKELGNQIDEKRIELLRAQIGPLNQIIQQEQALLNRLVARKEAGEKLTESELRKIDALKHSIALMTEEVAALNATAEASQITANSKDRLTESNYRLAESQQRVKEATNVTNIAIENFDNSTTKITRNNTFNTWLQDTGDTALLSAKRIEKLTSAIDDQNRSLSRAHGQIEYRERARMVEVIRKEAQEQIDTFKEIREEVNNLKDPTEAQILRFKRMLASLDAVDGDAIAGVVEKLDRAKDEIDQANEKLEETKEIAVEVGEELEDSFDKAVESADEALEKAKEAQREALGINAAFQKSREVESLRSQAEKAREEGNLEAANKFEEAARIMQQAANYERQKAERESRSEIVERHVIDFSDDSGNRRELMGSREDVEAFVRRLKQDKKASSRR